MEKYWKKDLIFQSINLNLFHWVIKRQSCYYIETNQLICSAIDLTGFLMMATLAFNELIWFSGVGMLKRGFKFFLTMQEIPINPF